MEGLSKIGIDLGGIIFYLINVGVIVFILAKFVYRPVVKFLDERKKIIQENLSEAIQLKKSFSEELEKKEAETRKAMDDLEKQVAEARAEAHAKAKEYLAEAEAERDRMLTEVRKHAAVVQEQLETVVEQELLTRVGRIVSEAVKQGLSGDEARVYIQKSWKAEQQKKLRENL